MKTPLLVSLGVAVLATALHAQDPAPAPKPAAQPDATQKQEAEKPKVYEVGTEVPEDLALTDLDGKTVTMKDLRGKIVVLTWYAYKCPAIKTAEPALNKMAKAYGKKDSEVVMIGINSDRGELADAEPTGVDKDGKPLKPYAKLRKTLKDRKVALPIYVDRGNVVADLFQAKTTPHMFVIDAKGVVRYSGALDNDPKGRKKPAEFVNYVDDAVNALKADKEVAVATTKPYG